MKAEQRPHTAHTRRGMRLPQLLCLATLAASSSSKGQAEEISIAYKVLEVYPQSRRVLLTCHAPQAPPPVTYFLFASQGIQVAKKVVQTQQPASFTLNVTLKSSPDLLTYSCEVASPSGPHESSAPLQLYWELWAKPVSQLQTNITLHSGGPGPRAEMSCWAPSGSPLITYRLVSKDGQVHMQQRPLHGQPANFSFPLPPALGWFQCQAENSVGVQSSALTLVPPAVASGMLGWTRL
ncbi:uncharacterized protein C17orf99 homolog isoform X2 [Heterocephalus glaber]|uniref:Uncharacterized protein C17orf99 homolog isoform X2 n=1 Tax=Heterocephalus glaber TaxID=10181 RepID=A0AAX6PWY7_HETGA|nr:uncharacterized protein C17orf99 homolog isoform X2 [Heterocephalus glaber]